MHRKRWRFPLSSYDVPKVDPNDRNAIEDCDLVRASLVDFDELAGLSDEIREKLIEDLVDSIGFARTGVKAGKRGVSNKALAQQIFLSDMRRALEGAGLPAKRWRKQYDNGRGESFFFRLAREIAEVGNIALPRDLKLPGKRAAEHKYGIKSQSTKVEQEDE
jgi:hypothetical protein